MPVDFDPRTLQLDALTYADQDRVIADLTQQAALSAEDRAAICAMAAGLVREGRSLSLSRPIDTHASARNPYPAHHLVPAGRSGGPVDYLGLFIHGFANTHLDALSHVSTADGQHFYNGRSRGEGFLPRGHTCGIDFWRNGVVTRGVLYDIPRLRGVECVAIADPSWLAAGAVRQAHEYRECVWVRWSLEREWLRHHAGAPGNASSASITVASSSVMRSSDA